MAKIVWHKTRSLTALIVTAIASAFFFTLGIQLVLSPPDHHVHKKTSEWSDKGQDSELEDGLIPKPRAYLAIMIISSARPEDVDVRNTIRRTWLQLASKHEVVYRFVIGNVGVEDDKISNIQYSEQDVLVLPDVVDDYASLSQKTLIGCKWFADNFEFTHLLKVDSDSFVMVPEIIKLLKKQSTAKPLYMGYFDGRAPVFSSGRWAETQWNLCDMYLPHALGGGYVLSYDLVQYLGKNAHLFKLYANEDKAVGAWLAGLDINYVHSTRFDTEFRSRGCLNDYVVTHKKTPADMRQFFNSVSKFGVLCKAESTKYASYEYNWLVLPSKCCKKPQKNQVP